MKIAYFFITPQVGVLRLIHTILPELESDTHSLNVVAMCFFDENKIALELDNEIGRRLSKLVTEKNIMLLQAETADMKSKSPSECVVTTIINGEQVGCYPNFYTAMGERRPERIISL